MYARTDLNCPNSKAGAVTAAIHNCYIYADIAIDAATSGPAGRVRRFFKDDFTKHRAAIANRYRALKEDCKRSNGPTTSVFCYDHHKVAGKCEVGTGVIAYNIGEQEATNKNEISICDDAGFWQLPPMSNECWTLDQGGILLREATRGPSVLNPRGKSHAEGFPAVLRLDRNKAFENADTYRLFAQAARLKCPLANQDEDPNDPDPVTGASLGSRGMAD